MDLVSVRRYQGFHATPPLWGGGKVSDFAQIVLPGRALEVDDSVVFKHRRLGKLVEEFVFFEMSSMPSVSWICDSLQVQKGKLTVGELDALYYDGKIPVHLEIAYKFYLYDTLEDHNDPLAYWIGPNRKDNLSLKLGKLSSKQFPLLYNPVTQPYLEGFNLKAESIEQRLCFKAQLFLPYRHPGVNVAPLNADCVAGFYLSYQALAEFRDMAFYVPAKLDWLIAPHPEVDWIDYASVRDMIKPDIEENRSPMIWMKHPSGELGKCFVVFW